MRDYAIGQRLRHPVTGVWEIIDWQGGLHDDWRLRSLESGHEATCHREYMERTFEPAPDTPVEDGEQCPTCESDDPTVDLMRFPNSTVRLPHDRAYRCPDPFHTPSEDAQGDGRSELGPRGRSDAASAGFSVSASPEHRATPSGSDEGSRESRDRSSTSEDEAGEESFSFDDAYVAEERAELEATKRTVEKYVRLFEQARRERDQQTEFKHRANKRIEQLEGALREIVKRPTSERNPDGVEQAAHSMQLLARTALETASDTTQEG